MSGNEERLVTYTFDISNGKYFFHLERDAKQIELYKKYGCVFRKIETEGLVGNHERDLTVVVDDWPLPIEFRTLEELMAFIDEVGTIVLGTDHIVLYDSYLE